MKISHEFRVMFMLHTPNGQIDWRWDCLSLNSIGLCLEFEENNNKNAGLTHTWLSGIEEDRCIKSWMSLINQHRQGLVQRKLPGLIISASTAPYLHDKPYLQSNPANTCLSKWRKCRHCAQKHVRRRTASRVWWLCS